MSQSAKRPKNRVASKMQDVEAQDMRQNLVSKVIDRKRLKTVLKNLSLLKLLKRSNPRIEELHNLAKRCWNSLLRVPTILYISSGDNNICNNMKQKKTALQEVGCPKKSESKKLESTEEPKEMEPEQSKPKVGSDMRDKAKTSPEAVPQKEEQVKLDVPRTSKEHSLTILPTAQGSQVVSGGSQMVFLKTCPLITHTGNRKQQEAADQWIWFEGLPTHIHLPGPRVMCRSSTLRLVKRCCTRLCSATLELPMYHPYRA